VAKNEKTASAKSSAAKEPAGEEAAAKNSTWFYIAGAVAAVVLIAGAAYWRSSSADGATAEKKDPDVAELMAPGPLPDVSLGKEDAPNTIVEYASMTCPHCAEFHKVVLPQVQAKYIDTGKARLILREFPLDRMAAYAFMLARCAGPDRYYPMVGALFETQSTWAVPGEDATNKLLLVAKQAGFSKEKFDQCIGDKELFTKIVDTRTRANEKFGVDSTPTFFVNGKRLTGEHTLEAFDAALSGGASSPATPASPAGQEPSKPEGPSGQ
jgi:protein-disulfide isomerase